jgi:putative oxidoreductase
MFHELVYTTDDLVLTVLRLTLGVIFFVHGAQKLFGWFGGFGYKQTMAVFTGQMGIPAPLALLAIVAEFFGGLGLIAGFLGRVAAVGVLAAMVVAMVMVHWRHGFFMNWYGNQEGEGVEYHLLAIALALAIAIGGSGAFSLDRVLSKSGRQTASRQISKRPLRSRGAKPDDRLAMRLTPMHERTRSRL